MEFNQHGRYIVHMQSNVIEVQLFGAFNLEAAEKYCSEIDTRITPQLNERGFYILLDLLKLEGGTPEAWQYAEQHNHWLSQQNLTAKLIVCDTSLNEYLASKINDDPLADKVHYFSTYQLAVEWVANHQNKSN